MRAQWFPAVVATLVALAMSTYSFAGESRSEQKARAKEATSKALAAELEGDLEARAKLLAEATAADPLSPANSQLGKVKAKGGWLSIDEAAEKISDQKSLQRYESMREKMADTAPQNWKMAEACLALKLPNQARAHMNRVLELDANYEPARAALGFKKIGGVWVSPEQLAADEAQAAAETISVNKHGKAMRELLAAFTSKDSRQQSKAEQRLLEIRDPSTILAAEKILSPANEDVAHVVVKYLANIKDPIATLSLARHAVFYPSADVRREAATKLGERDLHDYAPPLLSLLSSPIQSTSQPIFSRNGQMLGVRQVFSRESHDQNQVMVMDTEIARRQLNILAPAAPRAVATGRSGDRSLENATAFALFQRENAELDAIAQAEAASQSRSQLVQANLQNKKIAETNALTMQALSTATGVELPAYPDLWWTWYGEQSGLGNEGRKYVTSTRVYNQVPTSSYAINEIRHECFVAGTLVSTHRGQIAIEEVKLGDMVLSKNITTGALEFKPVLQTTIRPIEEVTLLRAGGNSFECTRGHFFWVSGRGWVKAEDLRPGMVLHAAENPVKIDEVCMSGEAETYNLRVADNANYFVGEGRILSHDVTARTPTREAIPGYIAAQ